MAGALGGNQYGAARRAAGVPAKSGAASTALVYSTWNSSDKAPAVLIPTSAPNIALCTGNGLVRDQKSIAPGQGKFYFEIFVITAGQIYSGIANKNATKTGYLGSDANGYGLRADTGAVYKAGLGVGSAGAVTRNSTIGVIYDSNNSTIEFLVTTGGDSGVLSVSSDTYFPAVFLSTAGDGAILNTGATAFVMGLPTNCTAWG